MPACSGSWASSRSPGRQDPAGRSVRHRRPSAAGNRAGGRRLLDLLPCHGNRHRQGVHRRGTAVQCPYSRLAGDRRHGRSRRSRRFTTTRTRPPATRGLPPRRTTCVRCRSTTASHGARSAGRVSSRGCRGRWLSMRTAFVGSMPRSWREAGRTPEHGTLAWTDIGAAAALNPHRPRHHRHRRPDRPRCAACGPGRPTACDRRRWRRAAFRANRARSPCRRISR